MQKPGSSQEKGCLDKLAIPIIATVVGGVIAGIVLLFIQYRSGLFERTNEPSPTPTSQVTTFQPIDAASDPRDKAAQFIGYANLDSFIAAFGIPAAVKPRIFACPQEVTWCLSVFEEQGQPDFHFKNATKCNLDGKRADGTSGIPVGFDGMVKGFTVRLCGK